MFTVQVADGRGGGGELGTHLTTSVKGIVTVVEVELL